MVPDASVPQPMVKGERTGDLGAFFWRVVGGAKPGDTWLWRRPDTGESERGPDRALSFNEPGRVCLQVQLIPRGELCKSTQECVG